MIYFFLILFLNIASIQAMENSNRSHPSAPKQLSIETRQKLLQTIIQLHPTSKKIHIGTTENKRYLKTYDVENKICITTNYFEYRDLEPNKIVPTEHTPAWYVINDNQEPPAKNNDFNFWNTNINDLEFFMIVHTQQYFKSISEENTQQDITDFKTALIKDVYNNSDLKKSDDIISAIKKIKPNTLISKHLTLLKLNYINDTAESEEKRFNAIQLYINNQASQETNVPLIQ